MKVTAKHILKVFLAILAAVLIVFLVLPPLVVYTGKHQIYETIDDVEPTRIAIVLGAGVNPDGTPSAPLEDRLITAKELYEEEKVEVILVSGDNRTTHYNEPQAMYNYLIEEGIPEEAIEMDFAGRRTYDTCYRANEIFGIDEAILVSQGYHLPRTIYLCNSFGVESTGISATNQDYEGELGYKIREIVALYWSVLDVWILKPTPVLGDSVEI